MIKGKSELNIDTYQQLVECIYDAALKPVLWQRFLEAFTKTLNGHAGIFRLLDAKTYSLDFSAVCGHDSDYVQLYHNHFKEVDPLRPILDQAPVGSIINRNECISDKQWLKSEMYNDYLKDWDVYHIIGGHVVQSGPCVLRFGAHRSKQAGEFDEDDVRFISRLVPHLRKAFKISRHIQGLNNAYQAATDTLDHMPIGIILVNAEGKPVYLNKRAESITHAGYGLMLKACGLNAMMLHEDKVLQQLIRQATQGEGRTNLKTGGAVMLNQTSSNKPLSLVVTPLGEDKLELGVSVPQAVAAIFIGDPEQQQDIPVTLLCSLYKLTKAEARLVNELANGFSPNEIAEKFGISRHTVRGQLKVVFQKTGAKRQSELVKLVLQGPAIIRGFKEGSLH